jgi:hypothetical protein
MTAADFRRIALSFDGAEEGSHMGAVDFRVGGHVFATLASIKALMRRADRPPDIHALYVIRRRAARELIREGEANAVTGIAPLSRELSLEIRVAETKAVERRFRAGIF